MTVWIVSQQTDFCDSKLQELIFDCIVGVIYCFSFFNLKEGKTRWRACVFYFVIFLENAALLSVWFLENQLDLLLKISLLIALFTAFVFGNYDLQQNFKLFHGYGAQLLIGFTFLQLYACSGSTIVCVIQVNRLSDERRKIRRQEKCTRSYRGPELENTYM